MAGCSDNAIVRNGSPACMVDYLSSKIGGIIVVAPDKDHPVIRFAQPVGNGIIDDFIIPRFLKAEAAVSGDDEQRIRAAISYAQIVYEQFVVSMNISGNKNLFCVRVIVSFHFAV
jgi:hypothetical protein